MIKAMKDEAIKEGATIEDYEDFIGLHNIYLGVGAMHIDSIFLQKASFIKVFYQKTNPNSQSMNYILAANYHVLFSLYPKG